ncbi:Hsp33 family molecular chaperone HslO [Pseudidiomarina andamanensis]|uniref:Hsp33 family molecular chaperone HslO n=1 Tax=Pseudidiomarina andamanensis TaxID=1940690 RepID=A0AA92IMI9_9GAMM|nr:Hsp33 family molecular chaperone HslO [Pseudidiomarina andamanensis]MDS0217716.1 Hsp33 family molecular chaperone HslO [Pseudidiomarina andamanensis]QGT96705.1 Hsp33 family molecular chaperone HslO [Pseudidiomarina andamanensis]
MSKNDTHYPTDKLLRYTFLEQDVRGELVQLSTSYQRMILGHDYPAPVQRLLGELMAAASLLTATLKFEGHISVQIQGDGPVNFVAVNGSHHQELRGIARVRSEIADDMNDLRTLMGAKAVMVITLTPLEGERYQGVVSADNLSIAGVVEDYFMQSEQLRTRIWLFADGEHAAGMMLQVMPAAGTTLEAFEHLEHLTDTISAVELFTLPGEQVLHRLYHEEHVELYPAQPVSFKCGCSREGTLEALASVSPEELREIIAEEGAVVMTCDYCQTQYRFTESDLA